MKHELCPACKPSGKCIFEEKAGMAVRAIKRINREFPLISQEHTLSVHNTIAKYRMEAQKRNCPNTGFDPDYPGKRSL